MDARTWAMCSQRSAPISAAAISISSRFIAAANRASFHFFLTDLMVRSSRDLDTAEMTITIDKFRNYSSKEAGVYLPGPDEKRFLQQIEIDASKNQQYL